MTPYQGRLSSLPIMWPEPWLNKLRNRSPFSKSSECADSKQQARSTKSSPLWRPVYLTRKALGAFLITFSALAIGLQLMLLLSRRNTGLCRVDNGLHRALWTYGPTAVLTLVASFWTRVECQMKTAAPWINLTKGFTTARTSLLLDYLSQFQLLSIASAIRNNNPTVAAVTFISVLIKVLLVLSTSLSSPSRGPIAVIRSNVPLALRSEFVNNPSGLTGNGSLAYANFASMMRFGTKLPRGTSDKYAYQLIESKFLGTPSTISTTLDGFFGDLECEPAVFPVATTFLRSNFSEVIPISSSSCGFNVSTYSMDSRLDFDLGVNDSDYLISFNSGACGVSSNLDDKRLAVIIGAISGTTGHENKTISNSNSFVCKPTYQIRRLDFLAQGSDQIVSTSKTADPRVMSNVHPWSIMQSHLDAVPFFPTNTPNKSISISNQTVSLDRYSFLAYLFANFSGVSPAFSALFEDHDGAEAFIRNYYQQYTALLAHTSLMRPISGQGEGTVTEVGARLLVRDMVANSMTGILVICIITVILIAVFDESTNLWLPSSLHSIIGLASCLSSSALLLEKFQGLGSTGYPTLRGFLDGWLYRICTANAKGNFAICTKERVASNGELEMREPEYSKFKPASLSAAARISVALVLVTITATLEVTLRISTRKDGLGGVPPESQYISYLWTTLPTIVFTLISMHWSSVDFDTRCLAPFLHLVQGSNFKSSVGLDLTDKHPLLLLYGELSSRSFEAMASTLAATLASLLTVFSAGLFSGVYVANTVPVQIHLADYVWFNTWGTSSAGYPDYSLATAALILDANLTYPAFTYEDLILPNMTVDKEFLRSHPNSSNIKFSGTFPAARPSFANCRLYNSSHVHLDFTSWSTEPWSPHGVSVFIEPENCFSDPSKGSWNLNVEVVSRSSDQVHSEALSSLPSDAYFGVGASNPQGKAQGCSHRLWAWGRWTSEIGNESLPQVHSVSALACNESMESVDVSASLFGPDLAINPKIPPVTNESSTSFLAPLQWNRVGLEDIYEYIPTLSSNLTDRLFDTFFTLLTTSRYAVPIEQLGTELEASAVAEAIKFHHRVIVAQSTAAARGLIEVSENSRFGHYTEDADLRELGYEIVPGTNRSSSYNVTASIPSSRHRVVQDGLSTRFLQGLLIAALICGFINWYLIHSAGGCQMIPRKPTTIANVAALLADSNIIDLLHPENDDLSAYRQTRKGHGRLEDHVFRMGWRDGHPDQMYSIYVTSAD